MLTSVVALLAAFAASFLLTPRIRDMATRRGLLDEPDSRKIHPVAIPRLGGVAIALAFYAGIAGALLTAAMDPRSNGLTLHPLPAVLVGSAVVMVIGILDDVVGMRARLKLLGQVFAALAAVALGLSIDRLVGPWGVAVLGAWSVPVTVLWLVLVMNAVNLIDGLDGLASGVALAAMGALFGVTVVTGIEPAIQPLLAAAAGAVLGFLRFNLSPASIIMGDTGAMLLGFLLATAGISLTQATPTGVPPWVPIVALGLPLADTAWTIVRRLAAGVPVFVADRRHIHHQLLSVGLERGVVVLALWAVALAFGIAAVILAGH
jgi:UDP-GlcNAc:undecaprenyl-phosphate GlcNAc-1-phosphate transferase